MRIITESPILGIEDRVLKWTEAERAALERAANLLAGARELVGEDSDEGVDLGKGEVVLREWLDGAVVESRTLSAGAVAEQLGV